MFIRRGFTTNSSSTSFVIWTKSHIGEEFLEDIQWNLIVKMASPLMKEQGINKPKGLSVPSAVKIFSEWAKQIFEDDLKESIKYREEQMRKGKRRSGDPLYESYEMRENRLKELLRIRRLIRKGYNVYLYNCNDLQGIDRKRQFHPWASDASPIGFMLQQYSNYWPIEGFEEEDVGGIKPLQYNSFFYDDLIVCDYSHE
jgi:hypothetical protein